MIFWRVIVGDATESLRSLPAESVQCVVTSPPYWGLRDYGIVGQLGLEATPELYVERMVEVFRGVRRVLRKDGTVWLNLGDSYAGSWSGNSMRPDGGKQRPGGPGFQPLDERVPARNGIVPSGLKPKDLCMIPFRLAKALQEPYYTGKIRKAEHRAWLAAAIDGEGCIHISRRKAGEPTGRNRTPRLADSFAPAVKVTNASEAFVRRCHDIAQVGTVRVARSTPDERTFWEWTCYSAEARAL